MQRTYLQPAPSQEAAAEALGLPFSTYRYHLAGGLARVAEALWQGAGRPPGLTQGADRHRFVWRIGTSGAQHGLLRRREGHGPDTRHPIPARMTATLEGDFVVLLLGMRINKPWKVRHWLPVLLAMRRMLREPPGPSPASWATPGPGRPSSSTGARSSTSKPTPATGTAGTGRPGSLHPAHGPPAGDVGIWHETFRVRAGEYEAIYSGMPPHGLGKVGRLAPVSGPAESARGRLRWAPHRGAPPATPPRRPEASAMGSSVR